MAFIIKIDKRYLISFRPDNSCRKVTSGRFCFNVASVNFNVFAVRIKYVIFDKLSGGFRHIHSLIFERFSDFDFAASAVDGRSYSDNGIIAYKS